MSEYILAIDPANLESGFCVVDKETYKPVEFGKISNGALLKKIIEGGFCVSEVAIEMVACYGMPVGREVFDTCVWIGRFDMAVRQFIDVVPSFVYRIDEKITICHSPHANDTTIRQALVDRFAYGVRNHGKGTKKEQGWFYGFKADVWAAYAVAVTYLDKRKGVNA